MDAYPHERTGARLIIVCGLPCSGKTTHAKVLESKLLGVRFCPDEWLRALGLDFYDEVSRERIEALQWKLAQHLLALGQTVIIEWGTWGRSERDALRIRARTLGAAVELHLLDPPMSLLLQRIERRDQESPRIQREDLLRWAELFETPSAEEIALFDTPTIFAT